MKPKERSKSNAARGPLCLVAFAVALMGCKFFRGPTTLSEQAKAAHESETTSDSWVGELNTSFTAVDGHEAAASAQGRGVTYSGRSDDGKACITIDKIGYGVTPSTGDQVVAKWTKEVQSYSMVWEMRDSLALPANTGWPAEPAPSTQTVRVVTQKNEKKLKERNSEISNRRYIESYDQHATIEACAPAATPRRSSRYLTLVRYKHGETPALYVWKLDPSSVADVEPEPVAADVVPVPVSDLPPTAGKRQPAGTKMIIDALIADGRFTWVVKIIGITGLEDTLGKDGPYTFFAPTDARLEAGLNKKQLADNFSVKNKSELRALLEGLTVKGIHPVDELLAPDSSLSGLRGFLHFVNKNGRPYLDTAEILPALNARNGIIYPTK